MIMTCNHTAWLDHMVVLLPGYHHSCLCNSECKYHMHLLEPVYHYCYCVIIISVSHLASRQLSRSRGVGRGSTASQQGHTHLPGFCINPDLSYNVSKCSFSLKRNIHTDLGISASDKHASLLQCSQGLIHC